MSVVKSLDEIAIEICNLADMAANTTIELDNVHGNIRWGENEVSIALNDIITVAKDGGYVNWGVLTEIVDETEDLVDDVIHQQRRNFAEGRHRIAVLALSCIAHNTLKGEFSSKCFERLPVPDIYYQDENQRRAWEAFLAGQNSVFKKMFDTIYRTFKDHYYMIDRIAEVLKNLIYVGVMRQHDACNAYTGTNSFGKPTSKADNINAVMKTFCSKNDVSLGRTYDDSDLETVFEAYYLATAHKKNSFDKNTATTFAKNYVFRDLATFHDFRHFCEKVDRFNALPIYCVVKAFGTRVLKLVYAMLHHGFDFSGNDSEVNTFLYSVISMYGVSAVMNRNLSGSFGGLFDDMAAEVNETTSINDLICKLRGWIEMNPTYRVDENAFKAGLRYLGRPGKQVEIEKKAYKEKYVKALRLFELIVNNMDCDFNVKKVQLEHSVPTKPDSRWYQEGFRRKTLDDLYYHFGSTLLLSERINKASGNKFIGDKECDYLRQFRHSKWLNTPANEFNCKRCVSERKKYAEERLDVFVDFWNELPMSDIMIIHRKKAGRKKAGRNLSIIDCKAA